MMIFAGINLFLSSERQRTSARGIALARPDIPVRQYLTGAAPAVADGGNVARQTQPSNLYPAAAKVSRHRRRLFVSSVTA